MGFWGGLNWPHFPRRWKTYSVQPGSLQVSPPLSTSVVLLGQVPDKRLLGKAAIRISPRGSLIDL